jgi:hypothetical protein
LTTYDVLGVDAINDQLLEGAVGNTPISEHFELVGYEYGLFVSNMGDGFYYILALPTIVFLLWCMYKVLNLTC